MDIEYQIPQFQWKILQIDQEYNFQNGSIFIKQITPFFFQN